MKKINRRQAIQLSAAGVAGTLLSTQGLAGIVGRACGLTPAQTPGPFYPKWDAKDQDTDLTRKHGSIGVAQGQIIYLSGTVLDENCVPVTKALVELWQASANGRYLHELDESNPNPIDPHFQYWGRTLTNEKGEYSFKTVIPGAYAASGSWMRPPHLHFKVAKRGFRELTTQMYFEGNQWNADDRILKSLTEEERRRVIVPFGPPEKWMEKTALQGEFPISIESV